MISETLAKLLPSEKLKKELHAILDLNPDLYGLTRKQKDEPDPGREMTLFAFDDGKDKSYPLIEIPAQWPGTVYVGRVPGKVRDKTLEFELDAIKTFGIDTIVCLLPEEDLVESYRVKEYPAKARERFGKNFLLVEVLDYEPAVNDEVFEAALNQVHAALHRGEKVLMHCGAACGRTGMFFGCLMIKEGKTVEQAVRQYRKARGCGPETEDQVAYIARYQKRTKLQA